MQKLTKIWIITLVIAILLTMISFSIKFFITGNCVENLTTGEITCKENETAMILLYLGIAFFIIWIIESIVLIAKRKK